MLRCAQHDFANAPSLTRSQGTQILSHRCSFISTRLGMRQQRNAMWPFDLIGLWKNSQGRSDDFNLSEHGRREEIEPRALLQEITRNVFTAHVSGGAERGFPITSTPIPSRI